MSQRANTWVNNDGLKVGFGPRSSDSNSPQSIRTVGLREEMRFLFKVSELGANVGAVATGDLIEIPANARIISATLRVVDPTDAAGTVVVGTQLKDGTAVDIDGLFSQDLEDAAAGTVYASSGALIGTANTAPTYLVASGTAEGTGRAEVVVVYERSSVPDREI